MIAKGSLVSYFVFFKGYDVRNGIPHIWPYSDENSLKSFGSSVSYCVVISRTTP